MSDEESENDTKKADTRPVGVLVKERLAAAEAERTRRQGILHLHAEQIRAELAGLTVPVRRVGWWRRFLYLKLDIPCNPLAVKARPGIAQSTFRVSAGCDAICVYWGDSAVGGPFGGGVRIPLFKSWSTIEENLRDGRAELAKRVTEFVDLVNNPQCRCDL